MMRLRPSLVPCPPPSPTFLLFFQLPFGYFLSLVLTSPLTSHPFGSSKPPPRKPTLVLFVVLLWQFANCPRGDFKQANYTRRLCRSLLPSHPSKIHSYIHTPLYIYIYKKLSSSRSMIHFPAAKQTFRRRNKKVFAWRNEMFFCFFWMNIKR